MNNENKALCARCKVVVDSSLLNCPLCGKHIDGSDGLPTATAYAVPTVKKAFKTLDKMEIAGRVLLLLLILTIITNIFTIFYTLPSRLLPNSFWSVYAIFGYLLLERCVLHPIHIRRFFWQELFNLAVLLSAFVVQIEIFNFFRVMWSVMYFLPALLSALSVFFVFGSLIIKDLDTANTIMSFLILFIFNVIYFTLSIIFWAIFYHDEVNLLACFTLFMISLASHLYVLLFRLREYTKGLLKKFHL